MSNRDLIFDSIALTGTLMMLKSSRFINTLKMEIKIVKDRTLSSHDYLMGQESTRVAYQKSLTEVCETFVHVTERLQGTLEFATMFEDTDSIEDRQRIIKRVDDVISTFLKLVNDYYRLEFMLRFKVGA